MNINQLIAQHTARVATATPVPTGGYPALVVASVNAPASWKAAADYQATGVKDHVMIQTAVDRISAAGGGRVQLSPGTFTVDAASKSSATEGSVKLKDNVVLAGCGIDVTVLKVVAGSTYDITGILRTPYGVANRNITVRDLTVDGNKNLVGSAARQIGFFCGTIPGSATSFSDRDIRMYRVRITNCNAYGFDPHAVTTRLVFEDCISDSNGPHGDYDGFTLDQMIDARVERCIAIGNGRHGFNIVTKSDGVKLLNCIAIGNGGAGIQLHDSSRRVSMIGCSARGNAKGGLIAFGTGETTAPANASEVVDSWRAVGCEFSENGAFGVSAYALHRAALINCLINDNATYGVTVQNVAGFAFGSISLVGNTITGNTNSGLLINGVPFCSVTRNTFANNCETANLDEIQLKVFNSVATTDCLIAKNLIYGTNTTRLRYGVREDAGCDRNFLVGNRLVGSTSTAAKLSGSATTAQATRNYSTAA